MEGEMVALFGAERCLFGSNFPVDKLWVAYGDMTAAYRIAAVDFSGGQRRAIFHDNAARLYGL